MAETKERLLTEFDKLGTPYKVLVIGGILCAGIYALYRLTLSPYLHNYMALKKELQSYQTLLDSKLIRTKAIEQLKEVQSEYKGILSDINNHFFQPEEADLFIKSLPQIIKGFGNTVIALKPIQQDTSRVRTYLLTEYINALPITPARTQGLDYVESYQADINAGDQMEFHLTALAKLLRRNKNDLRRIWVQAQNDPLARLYMKKIKIELKFQGEYANSVHVLRWLNDQDKMMDIHEVYMRPNQQDHMIIETHMFMSIYSLQEIHHD